MFLAARKCSLVTSAMILIYLFFRRLMLNPTSPFYAEFKEHLVATYEDNYFGNDALVMEINSRGIEERVAATNRNAEALADMLYAQSVVSGAKDTIVQEVFYPKYQSRENYDRCRNTTAAEAGYTDVGYGSLLSVTFTSLGAAEVFYDSLQCYKGPTMGTVVTLATPFGAFAFQGTSRMRVGEDYRLSEAMVYTLLLVFLSFVSSILLIWSFFKFRFVSRLAWKIRIKYYTLFRRQLRLRNNGLDHRRMRCKVC